MYCHISCLSDTIGSTEISTFMTLNCLILVLIIVVFLKYSDYVTINVTGEGLQICLPILGTHGH